MKLTYKEASQKDWKVVQSLFHEAVQTSAGKYHADTNKDAVIKFLLANRVFIITKGATSIGFISYSQKNPESAYIEGLVIRPKYKGKRYGTQAMNWLLEHLKDVKKIDLLTHPHNTAAIVLYLKQGFRIEDWKGDHYGDGQPRIGMVKIKGNA